MTKFGRIVGLFLFLVFLFIAVLATSLNLPYYYESRFPLSLLQSSSDLIVIENKVPNKYIEYLFGSMFVNKYFIDNPLNNENFDSFIIDHAVVEKLNDKVIGHIYSQKYSIIKAINNKIEQKYLTKLFNTYKNQLQTINLHLQQKNDDINALKKELIGLLSPMGKMDRLYASMYFNSLLAASKAEQTIALFKKTNPDAYLSIPAIANDILIQKLREQLNALKDTYRHLRLVQENKNINLINVSQEIITIKLQIDEQIKIIIKRLKNEITINKNLEEKFLNISKTNREHSMLFSKYFDKMQSTIEQKIYLKQQVNKIQTKIDNLKTRSDIKPVLIKYRLFERFCQNIIILIGIITLYLLYNVIKAIFNGEKVVLKTINENKDDNKFSSTEDLLNNLDKTNSIAFFSEKAELVSAKFILELRKKLQNSKILLVDFGNKIVTTQQKKSYGLNEVLCKRVALKEAIFNDKSCDVDILYSHNITTELNLDIINQTDKIIQELEKTYDFIIYSVSNEPGIPLESFLKKNSVINIIFSVFNDYEAKNWYWLLQHLGYNNINFIDIKDL